jgi:hypothetical protein
MTKEEIKEVCQEDDKMEWWAMVLFAEISVIVTEAEHARHEPKEVWPIIKAKVEEFPKLLVLRTIARAKAANEKKEKESEEGNDGETPSSPRVNNQPETKP